MKYRKDKMNLKRKFNKIGLLGVLFGISFSVLADDAKISFLCEQNKPFPKIEFDHNYLSWHWHDIILLRGGTENIDLPVSLSKSSYATFFMCEDNVCKNPDIILKYNKGYSSYSGYITMVDTKEVIYFSGDFDPDHADPCVQHIIPPPENTGDPLEEDLKESADLLRQKKIN